MDTITKIAEYTYLAMAYIATALLIFLGVRLLLTPDLFIMLIGIIFLGLGFFIGWLLWVTKAR